MQGALEKVRNYIRQHHLLEEGARVLVGLSGGPDSVCLARILDSLGYGMVAVHCNFHLRGDESQRDEQFVVSLCLQMGWELHRVDFDTQTYARQQKISIEMAARELRYEHFRSLLHDTQAHVIAVGHHQDDNIETLLLNAVRGTGIRGLCGMQPRNNDVVRPLLCLTRQEILAHLADIQQDFVTDHTNLEDAYARNKVRLDVLPLLEHINPGAMKNLASTQENLAEVMKVYQQAMQQSLAECVEQRANGEIYIHIAKLQSHPSPISILHEKLSPLGFNKAQMEDMLHTLHESGKVFTAEGRRALVDRQHIIVEAAHYPMPAIHQEVVDVQDLHMQKDPSHAYLDADKLHGELTLRTPRTGDTFAPFGMGGKRKLLSDYLKDLGLSRIERQYVLVSVDENDQPLSLVNLDKTLNS